MSLVLSILLGVLSILAFILVPTKTFEALSSLPRVSLLKLHRVGLFAFGMGCLGSYFLHLFLKLPFGGITAGKREPVAMKWPPWAVWALIVLSGYILVRASWGALHTPLNRDEVSYTSVLLSDNPTQALSPLLTESHTLSGVLIYASMRVFGVSKLSVRFPALLFTLFFLFLLCRFLRQHFSSWMGLGVLLCLAVNEMFLWFAHCARGYSMMMFFCLALFSLAYRWTKCCSQKPARDLWIWGTFFGVCMFTHTFAALFAIFLWLSLWIWAYFHWSELNLEQQRTISRFGWISLGWCPVLAFLFVMRLLHLDREGWFFSEGLGATPVLGELLGAIMPDRAWLHKIWLVGLVLGLIQSLRQKWKPSGLLEIFLALSFISLALMSVNLELKQFHGRMVLPFVPLVLIGLVHFSAHLTFRPIAYHAIRGSVLALLVLPQVFMGKEILEFDLPFFGDHEAFAELLKSKTQNRKCVTFSGNRQASFAFRHLYLSGLGSREPAGCTSRYHVYIDREQWGNPFPPEVFPKIYTEIYDDGKGRHLYQIQE